jgi:hypothetical protein
VAPGGARLRHSFAKGAGGSQLGGVINQWLGHIKETEWTVGNSFFPWGSC